MSILPQYPVSRTEQQQAEPVVQDPEQVANPTEEDAEQSLPSKQNFAQEVRAERLSILWKVTLFAAFITWWVLFVISGGQGVSVLEYLLPTLAISVGCILAGQFLSRDKFTPAVWSYAMGAVLAIGLSMIHDSTFSRDYMPFVFPLLVFVFGLMLPVRDTVQLMLLVGGAIFLFPTIAEGTPTLDGPGGFALALTVLATGLSAQVSGELYAIAEWALENYRKERQTTYALFESREALQKSFLRQTALTEEVQRANQELERSRKAEEEAKNFRGQFLANMSHELRTPLNAIIGFSQTMLDFPAMYDGVQLPTQYRQDMTQILNSGQHLLSIINDILDLSKVDAGKLELEIQPVDLGPIVKGVLSTAVGLVGSKKAQVELKHDTPDPLPVVSGDPLRVRQVLLNFYSNAAKFTDVGHIKLIIRTEGSEVIFGVEDTGCGIADSDRVSIFEEFRQGTIGRKKGRQGAGLGLAISQQLIRLMNGRLWFDSVLGKGSTFYFALPLYVASGAANGDEASQITTGPFEPSVRRSRLVRPKKADDVTPETTETTPAVADVS